MGTIIFFIVVFSLFFTQCIAFVTRQQQRLNLFKKKVTETSSGGKCETLQQQHHGQRLAEAVTVDPCSILDANGVLQEKRKGEICGGQALSLNKIHLHRLP